VQNSFEERQHDQVRHATCHMKNMLFDVYYLIDTTTLSSPKPFFP